jgi:hypothetical protein
MKKETLARAKELEEDIRQMEFALSYYKRGRWSYWDINDHASTFHFEFCKNWSHRDSDTQDLPKWLNKPLMEVVERELERCKTELENLGNEKPSAAECMAENMKELGKAISQMAVKASDLYDYYKVQTPPKPIGFLEHEESKTRIPVFKRIGWFHRRMLRWCFGVKYTKED